MKRSYSYRYPGSTPFQDTQHDRSIFFGREHERRLLFHNILGGHLLVLFAKSGVGKSSLLNAGVMQQLRKAGFIPLPIRFIEPDVDPLQTVYQTVEDIAQQKNLDFEPGDKSSLWLYFKTSEFWSTEDRLLTPVLVFDQFEEFFINYSLDQRKVFTAQLADLTRERPPRTVQQTLKSDDSSNHDDAIPEIKIIIALREDFLAELEEMSHQIPDILQNRFRLLPLNREQAEKAIKEPASLESEDMDSHTFTYKPDTVKAMLDFLCKRRERQKEIIGNEVESFQLQLLCSHIEEKLSYYSDKTIVELEDLGGETGMQMILEGFYDRQLKNRRSWERRKLIRLFEKGLISVTGKRLSLELEEIERKYEISGKVLNELVDNRILRADPRVGSVYYELSHDTLVNPIRESQRKRRRKASITGVLVAIFFVMATFLINSQLENYKTEIINNLYSELERYNSVWLVDYEEAQKIFDQIMEIDNQHVKAYVRFSQIFEWRDPDRVIEIYEDAINNGIENTEIYYRLAKVLSERERLDDAIINYKKAIDVDPNLKSAYNGLGDVYAKQKNWQKARENYEKSLSVKRNLIAYRQLVIMHINQGKFNDAIEVYKDAIKANIEYADICNEIIASFNGKGMKSQLGKVLEIASNVDSENASYFIKLGNYFDEQGEYDEAVIQYNKAITIDKKKSEAFKCLAITYVKQHKIDDAIQTYKRALAVSAEHSEIYLDIVNEMNRKGMESNLEQILNLASSVESKNASYYDVLGDRFKYQGKFDKAIEQYEKAIKIDPKYKHAYNGMGVIFEMQGKFDKAISGYNNAIKIAPDYKYAYVNLGSAYRKMGRFSEALEQYKKAIKIDPKFVIAYNGIGNVLSTQNMYEEAMEQYTKAIELDPMFKRAYVNLGDVFIEQDKYNGAVEQYVKAIEIDSEYAYAYNGLGNALSGQGKYSEAIEQYKKAIEIDPELKHAYNGLGNVFGYKGNSGQAIEKYKRAIEIDPEYKIAKEHLAEQYLDSAEYYRAYILSEELLSLKTLSNDEIMAMHSVSIASLMLQDRKEDALTKLNDFTVLYKSLGNDYERRWSYKFYEDFIKNTEQLSTVQKESLIKLVEILESPKIEGDKIIPELEALMQGLKNAN